MNEKIERTARTDTTDLDKQAVALRYEADKGAPYIAAKGRGLIAEQIIELAEQHGVHMHQSPELVDVLVRLELGEEIPEALYRAIAEIIAFAYSLKNEQLSRPSVQRDAGYRS
ncbi:EscU/YscU/HrcU family type III secretion system export apparatus switch protein [Marinobacterium arenosum]|uniref:EscU/YscU/HrcU family type III secretion system export apparatus switch protein n=1 Tax=Marinobacterium arenosum TaxID=2862496 RepID=UPI001C946632|nr:EscU/YscU/HrcU family type III secretion system export apparatus switch protein [Marinobacterium arenosum]MBY4675972.1 EscU/YscU/HrcU family type III secretion system export apparatus switch protein [Marinobacterium arenosum]